MLLRMRELKLRVQGGGRGVHRCVYVASMCLTLTKKDGKLAEVVLPERVLRVLGGDGVVNPRTGAREHVVACEGQRLVVSVREEERRVAFCFTITRKEYRIVSVDWKINFV